MTTQTLPPEAAVAQPVAKPLTDLLHAIALDARLETSEYISGSETPHGGE